MFVRNVTVQGIIFSIISVYATQCNLDESQKDHFYDSFTNLVRKLMEDIADTAGDINSLARSTARHFEH